MSTDARRPVVFGRRQLLLGGGTFVAGMAAVIAWTETHNAGASPSAGAPPTNSSTAPPVVSLQPVLPPPPSTTAVPPSTTAAATTTTPVASGVATDGRPAAYINHGPADVNNVALTFHFGGDPKLVSKLLDALKANGITSTLFAIGDWITANPKLTRRALDDGHELGNHTKSHQAMMTLSREQVRAEIVGGGEALTPFIGSIGKWFRPSGTDVPNDLILDEAGAAGYAVSVGYDVDSRDFKEPGAKAVVAKVRDEMRAGSIVSLHFGHQDTIDALPQIVELVSAAGLTPVTMTGLLG